MVKFRPEIEPVVRLIEDTPRDRALEVVIAQLKKGLSYKNLLAGLFLAGIRNIKPRPVGFKFHAVMVINSAHVLGQSSAVTERLLPLLWALDNFKGSQAQDVKEGDWVLGPVDEMPPSQAASSEGGTRRARWRSGTPRRPTRPSPRSAAAAGAAETMEPLWRAGVRDQRDIGHKAIFTAQSWRTLQTIGWEHAEPVLRSLVFGMLDLRGDSRPRPVGPYEANLENAAKIRPEWTIGRDDPAATAGPAPGDASGDARSGLGRGRQDAQPGDRTRFSLGCRHPVRLRAVDAQPGNRRHPRHDGHQRTPLHLHGQRRRHDPPACPAPGRRLAADVSRTRQTDRLGRHRLAQGEPRRPGLERRRGRRRDLRDHQRRSQEGRRQWPWPTWPAGVRPI